VKKTVCKNNLHACPINLHQESYQGNQENELLSATENVTVKYMYTFSTADLNCCYCNIVKRTNTVDIPTAWNEVIIQYGIQVELYEAG
jgi:hypothetical protein